ncbi:Rpn family recombination-promoting nuclease/putative transposase [Pedobacter frigoris]|uniref:Rpn family recombination-promoting nuclease/putative transposase n=1 Tax=Pedobacter frigoris TaxID=2571272 RepID=UPI00292CC1FF|nr:Rpn family recombination-promoting nuclease/putative transposase [Pedobacter frigoris]
MKGEATIAQDLVRTFGKGDEVLSDGVLAESGAEYNGGQRYVDPFNDWAFKRIFASEAHKEVILAFLNEVLKGKRQIQTITYTKNEYPGEIEEEGGSVFDFTCTDFDGTSFLVEVQRQKQQHFKERSLFYAGRLISDQAPKGKKKWLYNLKEVYSISLLENFCLQGTDADDYMHTVCLCNSKTREPFYDKLHFIYIEMIKFTKKEAELKSALDQWLYALKYASAMRQEPIFLNAPELTTFFELANYAKLTPKERDMYRTAQQRKWDEQNVIDYAREEGIEIGFEKGREEGRYAEKMANAKNLKIQGVDIKIIAVAMGLSVDEIIAL